MSRPAGHIFERSKDGYVFRYWQSDKGTTYTNYDCERRLESAISAVSRWFSRTVRTRTTTPNADYHNVETLRWKLERLTEHVQMMLTQLDDLEGVDRKRERIKSLREVMGRTPQEAAAFLAKADELEREER